MVEVISGNDERDPIAFGAKKAHSFTSKLLVEVRSRAQRGEKEIEIANVIESLPSATKQPTHAVKAGIGSIVVPIPSPPTTPAQQSQPGPGLLSTFTIHTAPSFDCEEVKKIIDWIHSFPNVNDENMPPAGGSSGRRSGHSK